MKNYCFNCMELLADDGRCPHCGWQRHARTPLPHQLKPGTILSGRYLLGESLGQGGFGITYIGRDLRLDMRIAVKEYYPSGYASRNTEVSSKMTVTNLNQIDLIEHGKERFLKEARVLANLHSAPGVVDVRDYFEENNTAYIVMEYLDGRDLRECLKDALFDPEDIFKKAMPIVETLRIIHKHGIIHRDISPDNIMLLEDGQMKLMDFGAARQMNVSDQRSVSVLLKGGYAPEEQYRPKGNQGPWTDVYAFCATLYKCITGITPDDSLQRLHDDEVKWPSELGIRIRRGYEEVLRKGMAVNQADRFQDFGELEDAIRFAFRNPELASMGTVALEMASDTEIAPEEVTAFRPARTRGDSEDDDATIYAPKERVGGSGGYDGSSRVGDRGFNTENITIHRPRGSDGPSNEQDLGINDEGLVSASAQIHAASNGQVESMAQPARNRRARASVIVGIAVCILAVCISVFFARYHSHSDGSGASNSLPSDSAAYAVLTTYYSDLGDYESQVKSSMDTFNRDYAKESMEVRSNDYAAALSLQQEIEERRSSFEADATNMGISSGETYGSLYHDILRLYELLVLRMDVLNQAWARDVQYSDPDSNRDYVLEPILSAQNEGTSAFKNEYDNLYARSKPKR